MTSSYGLSRRRILRGFLAGGAVSVGLPYLDCFLNSNGTALANGDELPACFGSWFQGLGFKPGVWEPKKVGANYELPEQFAALAKFHSKINIYSGLNVLTDGRAIDPHETGPRACLIGIVPLPGDVLPASLDSSIADTIGRTTRFRSIEASCWGDARSMSKRAGTGSYNPSEVSPIQLYTRIFGEEFQDPNAANFKPDSTVMLNRSIMSGIMEERRDVLRGLGASDRARLDEYFTSLRQLEQQLEIQLRKPAPMKACSVPGKDEQATPGTLIDDVMTNNKFFATLIAHAMACGQTRVFNVMMSKGLSPLRRAGSSSTFHTHSHEEPEDPKTGHQPIVKWFQDRTVDALNDVITAIDNIKEGDRTLLDRTVVLYSTDTGNARIHLNENLPLMTIGNANGRLKTGIHIQAKGDPVTRVGLTLQQAMGVPTSEWGMNSLKTSKTITEVL